MINQLYSVTPTKTRQVEFPSTITVPGTPLLLGELPCTNLDAYQDTIGGATCYFDGAFSFTVVGASSLSPFTGKAINPGDPIYATGRNARRRHQRYQRIHAVRGPFDGVPFGTLNSLARSASVREQLTPRPGVDINL